jgi:hypothetical protein
MRFAFRLRPVVVKLRQASSDKLALGVRRFPLTAMSALTAFPCWWWQEFASRSPFAVFRFPLTAMSALTPFPAITSLV